MMALLMLSIILFVTTDIYENAMIKMYSNDEKTEILIFHASAGARLCRHKNFYNFF
jgi:hypothetical protein